MQNNFFWKKHFLAKYKLDISKPISTNDFTELTSHIQKKIDKDEAELNYFDASIGMIDIAYLFRLHKEDRYTILYAKSARFFNANENLSEFINVAIAFQEYAISLNKKEKYKEALNYLLKSELIFINYFVDEISPSCFSELQEKIVWTSLQVERKSSLL